MVTPRQLDVFRNPNPRTNRAMPWLLVLQADLLEDLPTRLVAPLVRSSALKVPATRLNPVMTVAGERAVMLTQQLSAVSRTSLTERVTHLNHERHRIIAAVDFLLAGV